MEACLAYRIHVTVNRWPGIVLGNELNLRVAGLPERVVHQRLAGRPAVGEFAAHVVSAHEKRPRPNQLNPVANRLIQIPNNVGMLDDWVTNEGLAHLRTLSHVHQRMRGSPTSIGDPLMETFRPR